MNCIFCLLFLSLDKISDNSIDNDEVEPPGTYSNMDDRRVKSKMSVAILKNTSSLRPWLWWWRYDLSEFWKYFLSHLEVCPTTTTTSTSSTTATTTTTSSKCLKDMCVFWFMRFYFRTMFRSYVQHDWLCMSTVTTVPQWWHLSRQSHESTRLPLLLFASCAWFRLSTRSSTLPIICLLAQWYHWLPFASLNLFLFSSPIGTCQSPDDISSICTCDVKSWTGAHCEEKVDYCKALRCLNGGVCRPLLGGARCECVSDSYSGEMCEIVSKRLTIRKMVSKSLAYVAIIAMCSVMLFVIVMDVLKYCFGIDPVEEVREEMRQEKARKQGRKRVVIHYKYVHDPSNVWLRVISIGFLL